MSRSRQAALQMLSLFLAFSMGFSAFAAPLCQDIFAPRERVLQGTDLSRYQENRKRIEAVLAQVDPKQKERVEHLLLAAEFYDYANLAPLLLKNFLSGQRETLSFANLYDRKEEPGTVFKNFVETKTYLESAHPEVTIELFRELQRRLMANGVEETDSSALGEWRSQGAGALISMEAPITKDQERVLTQNRYASFEEGRLPVLPSERPFWEQIKIWGETQGQSLHLEDQKWVTGNVIYPIVFLRKAPIDLIKETRPDVYAEVETFRKAHPNFSSYQLSTRELEVKLVDAFVEERFQRFQRARAALGEIQPGINDRVYVEMVADFQRDLVSIHPFANGNGRSTRALMNYLLTKEGLPPARLLDPGADLQLSPQAWRESVVEAVKNEARLVADLLYRAENGLTPEYSPELLYPQLPETVKIALKKQGSTSIVNDHIQVPVDHEQFSAFLKALVEKYPELRRDLEFKTLPTMTHIVELFVEFYRSKHIEYVHDKDGQREISLSLIDPDFIDLFGVIRSGNPKLWNAKMNRWYDRKMLLWRGVSDQSRERSVEDLLMYFTRTSSHLLSNQSLSSSLRQPTILAIRADFKKYNQELVDGSMPQMAEDHHQVGPRYRQSYGYSTSKREVVAKAYAMGAMVIAPYGQQNDPVLQAKLKSRINVASYRAQKDVDLGRLKAFAPEFSYIYGRQAEVMGVGGTDPDAVILVQRIDANGVVTETLFRNMDNPDEILLIEGRYLPEDGPIAPERIKRRILLSQQGH